MADRGGHQRGGRGGGRGDHRGGRGGGRGGAHNNQSHEKPKKENILDLAKYMDKKIVVKFTGGREGMLCCLLHARLFGGYKSFRFAGGIIQRTYS